jgi:hypothetical protein
MKLNKIEALKDSVANEGVSPELALAIGEVVVLCEDLYEALSSLRVQQHMDYRASRDCLRDAMEKCSAWFRL